jgi:hypothetical protein
MTVQATFPSQVVDGLTHASRVIVEIVPGRSVLEFEIVRYLVPLVVIAVSVSVFPLE